MRQWRLIYDSPTAGAINMARDEALLYAITQPDALPTLRLYAWEPLCLSLGYGQRVRDVDQTRLNARGWELIRRPTGGKAILHGRELTYSIVLPRQHELAQGDVVETYRRISKALIAGLQHLGVSPESEKQAKGNTDLGPVCFEVPSHYEITADGKKLIGSAQVRRKDGILQHGTLPLYGDITQICDVLAYPDDQARLAAKIIVQERATTLASVTGRTIQWEEAATALIEGFTKHFDVSFVEDDFTQNEQACTKKLLTERYTHPTWIQKR